MGDVLRRLQIRKERNFKGRSKRSSGSGQIRRNRGRSEPNFEEYKRRKSRWPQKFWAPKTGARHPNDSFSVVGEKLSKITILPTTFNQKFGQKLEATCTVTPPAIAATLTNSSMSSEQMDGTISTVTTSADYFQSVFISTSSFANVFKFEDSEFWFPKIKVRDKLSRFSGIR